MTADSLGGFLCVQNQGVAFFPARVCSLLKKKKMSETTAHESIVKEEEHDSKQETKTEENVRNEPQSDEETVTQIPQIIRKLHKTFATGKTKEIKWRRKALAKLKNLVSENEQLILKALQEDLGRCKVESVLSEIAFLLGEIDDAISNLGDWTKDVRVATPISQMKGLTTSCIHKEPLGVVLIISPWNYPFALCIAPLIGAISAGNCVALKPSEVSPHTSALLAQLIPKYLDPDAITVVEGGIAVSRAILAQKFDHIFFTGSTAVGKIVMKAAAEHLTPVTLELGGKSPCIIDSEVDLDVAVRRTVWGKFWNAGQSCIAPDYVLIHQNVHDAFIEKLQTVIKDFYGENAQESSDYSRIISARHLERLAGYIDDVKSSKRGEIIIGGEIDKEKKFISPTVVTLGTLSSWSKKKKTKGGDASTKGKEKEEQELGIMSEEIFGPIMPILKYKSLKRVVKYINSRPKPLAMYMFTKSKANKDYLVSNTSSGGIVFNDVLMHYTNTALPFGGVGESGMGRYHGKLSFDAFTHERAVVNMTTRFDLSMRYPPYDDKKLAQLRRASNW